MTEMTAHRRIGYDAQPLTAVKDQSPGFRPDSNFRIRSTERHVIGSDKAPVSPLDEASGQVGRLARPSLGGRTVAHWQKGARVGTLAGTLVAAAGLATSAAILIGTGKGAAIGAAVGSIIPGAGTVVGAIVGGVLGGLVAAGAGAGVGALIGRVAGARAENVRADRLRVDDLILRLLNEKKITPEEAASLRRMSDSDLSALVSISKGWTGIAQKADRDAVRRAVLMAAATDPSEAKLLKAELLKLPPERAALGARNVIALGLYLRTDRESLFMAARQDPVRLHAHWRRMRDAVVRAARAGSEVDQTGLRALSREAFRQVNALRKAKSPNLEAPNREALATRNRDALRSYLRANQSLLIGMFRRPNRTSEFERFMQDAVVRETRRGKEVDQVRLNALLEEAIEHVNTFPDDQALKSYQERLLAFEAKARSFIELAAGEPTPEEMADRVMDLRESFDAMQRAKGLDQKGSAFNLFPRFEDAFARAATHSSISPAALVALRTVHDAGRAIRDLKPPPFARAFDDFDLDRFRLYGDGVRSTVAATVAALAGAYGVPTTALKAAFKESEDDGGMVSSDAIGRKDPKTRSEAKRKSVMEALERRFRAVQEVKPKSNKKSESESDEEWIV